MQIMVIFFFTKYLCTLGHGSHENAYTRGNRNNWMAFKYFSVDRIFKRRLTFSKRASLHLINYLLFFLLGGLGKLVFFFRSRKRAGLLIGKTESWWVWCVHANFRDKEGTKMPGLLRPILDCGQRRPSLTEKKWGRASRDRKNHRPPSKRKEKFWWCIIHQSTWWSKMKACFE